MARSQDTVIFELSQCPAFVPLGEDRSALCVSGTCVTLEVFFDSTDEEKGNRLLLKFSGVSQTISSAFPGVNPLGLPATSDSLSTLVRIESSPAAREWTAYWNQYGFAPTHHYQLILTSENRKYDIFARDVEVLYVE